MYQFLKDFAGPTATIVAPIATIVAAIAAIVAAITAAMFVRRQTLTAEKQAETALDQLRYNLYEKRYAIYEDVQEFIKFLVNNPHKKDLIGPSDVIPHYLIIDEARFFFSDETCSWLDKLRDDCQSFIVAHASKAPLSSHEKTLVDHLAGIRARFQEELGFRQLTQHVRRSTK